MVVGSAPGKIILAGEHAVVYGRPALAIPVHDRTAKAEVRAGEPGAGCRIAAPQIRLDSRLRDLSPEHPLALIVRLTLTEICAPQDPDLLIEVRSTIPIASGLGSGAAVSTAVARALFAEFQKSASNQTISSLVFESERIHHGTPSGIDNTVIAFGKPVWFVKGQPPEPFSVASPVSLLIADSGISASTRDVVGDVRQAWINDEDQYDKLFDSIATIVRRIRLAVESGATDGIGPLLSENQAMLREIGVSSPELEKLIDAALKAGSPGAKLSGAGRGGNMITVVDPRIERAVESALLEAGARSVIRTTLAADSQRS